MSLLRKVTYEVRETLDTHTYAHKKATLYRVAKTHRMSYLYRLRSAEEPYN